MRRRAGMNHGERLRWSAEEGGAIRGGTNNSGNRKQRAAAGARGVTNVLQGGCSLVSAFPQSSFFSEL